MAKLSARGRTELVRMTKEDENPNSDLISYERTTIAFMSDNRILEKRDVVFKNDSFGPHKHTYNWTVKMKCKQGVTKEKVIEVYSKKGYKVVG